VTNICWSAGSFKATGGLKWQKLGCKGSKDVLIVAFHPITNRLKKNISVIGAYIKTGIFYITCGKSALMVAVK